jgi:hypothetical protein
MNADKTKNYYKKNFLSAFICGSFILLKLWLRPEAALGSLRLCG